MDPGLYMLTQWAAFPLYFLRALVPMDPALYRYHPPASWPPERGDGGARAADGGDGRARRGPAPAMAGMVVRGGVPGGRPAPVFVDRLAQRDGGGSPRLSGQRRGGLRSRGPSLEAGAGRVWPSWCSPCSRPGALVRVGARGPRPRLGGRRGPCPERAGRPVRPRRVLRGAGRPAGGGGCSWRRRRRLPRTTATGPTWVSTTGSTGAGASGPRAAARPSRAIRGEASVHDYLGQILRGLGRDDEAAAEFEAAIAAEPTLRPRVLQPRGAEARSGRQSARRAKLLDAGVPLREQRRGGARPSRACARRLP